MKNMKEKNDKYPLSISDWITILQEKSSIDQTRIIFIISLLLAIVVATPVLATKYIESNFLSMLIILVIFSLFIIIVIYTIGRGLKNIKPYRILYDRIIKGELTEPKEILKEYKKIIVEKNNFYR
jgi:hypothetical protein